MAQTKIRNEQLDSLSDTKVVSTIAFRAERGSATSVSDSDTIVFDSEVFDTGSGYNNSTGLFAAPVAGLYFFSAGIRTSDADNTARRIGFEFREGASTTRSGVSNTAYEQYTGVSGSIIIALAASATMKVVYRGTSGNIDGNAYTFFQGHLIAATA